MASAPTAPSATRTADPLFEAVCTACVIDWHDLTPSGRGPINRAVKELRAVGATAGDVTSRAAHYHQLFDGAALTPSALAKHWAQCEQPPSLRGNGRVVEPKGFAGLRGFILAHGLLDDEPEPEVSQRRLPDGRR